MIKSRCLSVVLMVGVLAVVIASVFPVSLYGQEGIVPLNFIVIKLVPKAPVYLPGNCDLFVSFQNQELDKLLRYQDVVYMRFLFPENDVFKDPTPEPAMPVFILYFSKPKASLVELNKTIALFKKSQLVEWAGYVYGIK